MNLSNESAAQPNTKLYKKTRKSKSPAQPLEGALSLCGSGFAARSVLVLRCSLALAALLVLLGCREARRLARSSPRRVAGGALVLALSLVGLRSGASSGRDSADLAGTGLGGGWLLPVLGAPSEALA